ncbi:MAG: T9SS type A sorting domain-containing protein [Saprospiraceae bacterium]
MRKTSAFTFLFLSLLVFSSRLTAQCSTQYIRIQDPKQTWKSYQTNITEAVISAKPHGLFVEFGVYLTYAAPAEFSNISKKDTFEIQHYFQLPDKAIVNDSWLWVNNTIMQALILDRWSAFNIYEGIVKRRQDPSILYKNSSTSYEYRIFPLAGGNNIRKVKISALMPADWKDGKLSADLPLSMIAGTLRFPDLKLISYDSDEWQNPTLSDNSIFTATKDSLLGDIRTATIKAATINACSKISISYAGAKGSGIYFSHAQDKVNADEGVYQFAVQPKDLLPASTIKAKKILFLIDHDDTNATVSSKDVIQNLKNYLSNNFDSRDSFNIFYNRLSVRKVSSGWMRADSNNIYQSINSIVIGSSSLLKSGLSESYDFINSHNGGSLVVFSADQSLGGTSNGQKFKDELIKEYKTLAPTYIIDYSNLATSAIWYQGVYYYGNELFYTILSSNTFGSFIHVQKNPDYVSFSQALSRTQNAMENNLFVDKQIELYIRPTSGACFERFEINTNALDISKPIVQVGKYKGALPMRLEATVISKGQILSNSIVLNSNPKNGSIEKFTQIHAGLKVIDMESRSPLSNIQINNIIDISKKNRVMSRYTSFLALEPGMQAPCTTCVNETKTGGSTAADDIDKDSITVNIFPNPFRDQITIEISGLQNQDKLDEIGIYNLQGQLIVKFDHSVFDDGKAQFKWDAANQSAGMYIFRLKTADKVINKKIIKIE